MKKLLLISLLFIQSSLFAQEWIKIHMINGEIITGQIIENVPQKTIKVRLKGGYIFIYSHSKILRIEPMAFKKIGSLGVGIGIPYGTLGVNGEYAIVNNLCLTAGIGIGTLSSGGAGFYNFGAKYYLKSRGKTWRPRISAYYGSNYALTITGDLNINEVHNGLTIGLGQKWALGNTKTHGIDLDILFIITSGIFARVDEIESMEIDLSGLDLPRIRLSFGYRYGF